MASKKKTEEEIQKELLAIEKAEREANLKALDMATKAINKKYGEVVSSLSDHNDNAIPTVSTGCISLDAALGCGGMGLGRIYEIYGPAGGGKSTLAVNVIVQAQRRGLKCLYIDAEHAADPQLFKSYGVDSEALTIVQGYDGEQNLDILERYIKTGAIDVAVVDSVSALIPRKEAENDIDQDTMALQARLMSKALRKITPIANQTSTLLMFINQLRMKVGGYGNPETTTGGESLPFYSTGRISVRGPEAKSRRISDETTGEVIGHEAQFEIVKNKLAAPFKKTSINLIYGKGYDAHWEILDMAVSIGIIDKKGAWYKYEDAPIAQGDKKALLYLKENPDFYEEIRNKTIDMLGMREIYELHGNPGPIYPRADVPEEPTQESVSGEVSELQES